MHRHSARALMRYRNNIINIAVTAFAERRVL